ncbi:MAG: CCA tRNA nucleotidyltransferase, partial [Thermoplasmata archaeon]|nr:CCA tRNA nucleotidyltransferase [Thermoplasmata archaeon]
FEVDLVPCYKLASPSERMSAVDRTPFHTHYIIEHLSEEGRREVLLLKCFMKGVGVYGAEASIGGFSGYLCELLILRYGSFHGVLEAALTWKPGLVLALDDTPPKRFSEPLAFVDPVDANRNVAAAVTKQVMAFFSHASSVYRSSPKEEFFFPNTPTPMASKEAVRLFEERGSFPLLVTAPRPKMVEDVLYPQFLKFHRVLVERCGDEGFPVISSFAEATEDRLYLLLELEKGTRPRVYIHLGPPVWSEHSSRFLEKWEEKGMGGPYIKDGHWVVAAERSMVETADVVLDGLARWGIGKDLGEIAVSGGFSVQGGKEAVASMDPALLALALDKRPPWEW